MLKTCYNRPLNSKKGGNCIFVWGGANLGVAIYMYIMIQDTIETSE